MFKEISLGFSTYLQALRFVHQNRLWKFILIPAFINLLIFIGAGVFVWQYTAVLSNWLVDITGIDSMDGDAESILGWIVGALVKIISFFIYFKIYRYTLLLLSAPALALIAERTQEILTGISYPFNAGRLVHDILRGIGITIRNLILELLCTIPLYLLAFIPLVTPFATIAILLIESYFVGFSMIDYRNEFRRLTARESIRIIRAHKGLAIGNGLAFTILLLIPVVGVLFAPPLGAVAAGLATNQVLDNSPGSFINHQSRS